ncbi:hypothetical protein GCM10011392_12290 [Wenxinia marina]|uniref:Uncharacterized protein n=1 Tax=Wenxinia marina DSM 24838 TaxID=1123501 RepID=A0A0D0Q4W7_9RHOB|nr:hypothetical protein Wenmar_01923 [Wenxinia marina DSM 24838]GGL59332.1 hypothetical protein GCM10011392_12290 [Wenxinia marina]
MATQAAPQAARSVPQGPDMPAQVATATAPAPKAQTVLFRDLASI